MCAGCEDLCKHLQQGWLPVPKGVHHAGGDPSRILSDRMTRKAQQRTTTKVVYGRSPGMKTMGRYMQRTAFDKSR